MTTDEKLYMGILKRIMREQGVSLLQAHQQLLNTISNAVDAVREEYLKDHNLTIEELINS